MTPGDHLQTIYNLWLPGHQLATAARRGSTRTASSRRCPRRVNTAGWPFAAVFAPLEALLGTVAGWNVFVLLTYVGAGGFAALWLRALGLPLGAALTGGLVFALAPYRVAQSTGHLLGPVSMLLPLALFGVERRRGAGSPWPRSPRFPCPGRFTSRSARFRSCWRTRALEGGGGSVRSRLLRVSPRASPYGR